ncbi:ArnT family glycosyltransferase, partial [Planctomycetota bacterium]
MNKVSKGQRHKGTKKRVRKVVPVSARRKAKKVSVINTASQIKPAVAGAVKVRRRESKKRYLLVSIVFVLAGIPFLMGKYIEFNSPGPFDSGSNVYSAKHILDGARIGIEEEPSAAMGTLIVNMVGVRVFGFNEVGPKVMQGLLQAVALVLMFVAMRKLFGMVPASVSVIVCSIYLSSPLIAKFGNVKEQYMVAFMVSAVSCFVLGRLSGRWWWIFLAGVFAALAPTFKMTGISAGVGLAVFVVMQPIFKQGSYKCMIEEVGLLVAGAAAGLFPVYAWLWGTGVGVSYWPYYSVFEMLFGGDSNSYVSNSRRFSSFSQQWPMVLRYYKLLILPISLGLGAIVIRLYRMFPGGMCILKEGQKKSFERFVFMFSVWWVLDMGFVWISPRSYEQYYLPLTASGAMLGGYLIAMYLAKVKETVYKVEWGFAGFLACICMVVMSWHIFFGIERSPNSGSFYGRKSRGYTQRLGEISRRRQRDIKFEWEKIGDHIREHSEVSDRIYVWGWYPGIYVRAQRLSPAAKAFTSEMHVMAPAELAKEIGELLESFGKDSPKFVVDSRKRHYPWDRP